MNPYRVAIVGSRTYADLQQVRDFVASLPADAVVISGGARGVDTVAEEAARGRGLRTEIYPADWTRQDGTVDRGAGLRRNQQIVRAAQRLVCFWNGTSRGSKHTLRYAYEHDVPILLFLPGKPPREWRKK